MKGRIALYGGYFVAMLLLAAYLTGVLQQGILPRLLNREAAPQQDEQPATGDPESASQESDRTDETTSTPESQDVSALPDEKLSAQPAPQTTERSAAPTRPQPPPPDQQRSVIADEEKMLSDKRADLIRLEEQIRKRKEENKIEEKWLAELKASGAQLTKERDVRREAGIKRLAKLYEGMEPEAAASILTKLKQDMATEVLAAMRDRQASKVLAAMNGQKAKELSERIETVKMDQPVDQGKGREAAR